MFFRVGGGALVLSLIFAYVPFHGSAWIVVTARAVSAIAACYGIGMAAYMTYGSRIGKVRTRDRLLRVIPWTGSERVLDVGCGRGLMAVGAALQVPNGEVIGIDLWSAADQADNTPDAARENTRRAGVVDRVRIDTGDVRALPYEVNSFDVVLSHWVVHNLATATDRAQALREMLRVLRPDGWLILADISHQTEYIAQLHTAGITHLREERGGLESTVIGFFSGNTFRPQAIIARKPVTRF
ncbi:class I SAM-dependent methyltransferase [Gemmatimonas groenlandica]|uniref:Class I SAM-dependent methyltransferase n=1 Tax=Gemmatimonas groenlandica TaxID=2732249 RepID=A0A6M4IZG5_9BACT|nr:class I SAM-dependent methyltransferase [Gemmatimonas groenlandica]QJR37611.1 class I SAM-dependent methyltransferase [Gemmatimonas groenlandica]